MEHSRISNIFQGVKEKYLQPEELQEWSNIVDEGLTPYEDQYIRKYINPKGNLLDIGCGGGREGMVLASLGYKVVGIDLVLPMVMNAFKNAQKKQYSIKFLVMNALNLGFRNNTFTSVLMLGQVLTFIPFRTNRILALKEVFRVVKPGGKLILTTHSRKSHIKYRLYFLFMDNLRRFFRVLPIGILEPGDRFASTVGKAKSKGKHYLHMYTMEEMYQDLSATGFKVIGCHSRKEILEHKEMPDQRQRDYYLIYAALKEKQNT